MLAPPPHRGTDPRQLPTDRRSGRTGGTRDRGRLVTRLAPMCTCRAKRENVIATLRLSVCAYSADHPSGVCGLAYEVACIIRGFRWPLRYGGPLRSV